MQFKKTQVMGIINATPDSFSGDGVLQVADPVEKAVEQALRFETEGAAILDIGGESTRPGSEAVSAAEEISRVVPIITAIREKTNIPISIDTSKAAVATAALEAGADWVNDVWGLQQDPEMAAVVAEANCPVVVMHNKSTPKNVSKDSKLGNRYTDVEYEDVVAEVKDGLKQLVVNANKAGISKDRIIIDPGLGFGKTVEQNLLLIKELTQIVELGYPVLIGASRKSFVGYSLDLPPEDRVEGSITVAALCVERGAQIVRVHDVKETMRAVRMVKAVLHSR
jgi:dihydropteroate synthase